MTRSAEKAETLRAERVLQTDGPDGWTILRLAGIYGPGRQDLLNQVLAGHSELPGEGETCLNLIRVEDICAANSPPIASGSNPSSAPNPQ